MAANLGNVEGMLMMDALNLSGTLAELPEVGEAALAEAGVGLAAEPMEALMATAEAFGAEVVDPDQSAPW